MYRADRDVPTAPNQSKPCAVASRAGEGGGAGWAGVNRARAHIGIILLSVVHDVSCLLSVLRSAHLCRRNAFVESGSARGSRAGGGLTCYWARKTDGREWPGRVRWQMAEASRMYGVGKKILRMVLAARRSRRPWSSSSLQHSQQMVCSGQCSPRR